MNKQEFSKYIAETFECSPEAADAVITLFSEGVYNALLEGKTINLETFGEFKFSSLPSRKIYSRKHSKMIASKPCNRLYFKPAPSLKMACSL
jgi:nucleoid DNA-binding protein